MLILVSLLFASKDVCAQSSGGSTSIPPVAEDELLILSLQESGTPTSESQARLLTPFPELKSFTVCYWLRLGRYREESTLMSYATSDDKDNELRMDHRLTGFKVTHRGSWAKTRIETPLRRWTHFCFSFAYNTDRWQIFVDGKMEAQGTMETERRVLAPNGSYVIGQEQDTFGGGFYRDQSFSGEITELNFWDNVISDSTIEKIAKCSEMPQGNAFGWSSQKWRLEGEVRWSVQKKSSVCDKSSRLITFFPDRFTLNAALRLCQAVDGGILVPKTEEENTWIYNFTKSSATYCSGGQGSAYLWLGAYDQAKERQWVYWNTEEILSWEGPWRGVGPNGGTEENCLVMLTGDFPGRWSDIACLDTYSYCVPCEFDDLTTLHFKGPAMCRNSPFNTRYFFRGERDGKPLLAGYFHSDIYWNASEKSWILQSLKNPDAKARWTPDREGKYPFGTQRWTILEEVCGILSGTEIPMTLSTCGDGQFTCADGLCIDLSQRCDLRVDCLDQSDESNCSHLDIPNGYNIDIPPPPPDKQEPLPIYFTLELTSFPSIVTQDLTFTANFKLSLRWQDMRINFLNLKNDLSLNLLSPEVVAKIWTPRIFFSNAQNNVFTNLDQGSRVECVRQGPSVPGPPTKPVEVNIYSGNENSLEMSQLYSVTYTCDFNLEMFPFDSQVCSLRFTMVSASSPYLKLVTVNNTYTGRKNLIEYTINDLTTWEDQEGDFSQVTVQVKFSRRYEFYLLTLYIPTTLLIIVAYSTFYFNPNIFQPRIIVALTALLVLSSLFTQTSNSLPKTSYFKLVDVWLFFSIFIIFIMIIIQTMVEFSSLDRIFVWRGSNSVTKLKPAIGTSGPTTLRPQQKKLSTSLIILLLGRVIIPVIFLIFNFAYWGKAIS